MARELPEALRFRCRKCGSLWQREALIKQSKNRCPLCNGQLDPEDEAEGPEPDSEDS